MACVSYSASAPGSFMISGEHAVLRGEMALVAAIDKRIHVSLVPRKDSKIFIKTDTLGNYQTDLTTLRIEPPFNFVLATIDAMRDKLNSGFGLVITSELSHQVGLSSSAAVTVATLSVLAQFAGLDYSPLDLFHQAKSVIQSVQGAGSGADVAAAVFGGVQAIKLEPFSIEPLKSTNIPWYLVYTGYKTPTSDVVAKVNADYEKSPEFYRSIFGAIGAASQMMRNALQRQDVQLLGHWMNRHSALQAAMQLVCLKSKKILDKCQSLAKVSGAKISGSGLGDCVLVLGELSASCFPGQMAVNIAPLGILKHG